MDDVNFIYEIIGYLEIRVDNVGVLLNQIDGSNISVLKDIEGIKGIISVETGIF